MVRILHSTSIIIWEISSLAVLLLRHSLSWMQSLSLTYPHQHYRTSLCKEFGYLSLFYTIDYTNWVIKSWSWSFWTMTHSSWGKTMECWRAGMPFSAQDRKPCPDDSANYFSISHNQFLSHQIIFQQFLCLIIFLKDNSIFFFFLPVSGFCFSFVYSVTQYLLISYSEQILYIHVQCVHFGYSWETSYLIPQNM